MSTPETQDADNKPALPPSAAAEALTVSPQDCPEVAFAEKVVGSTPSPESETDDVTGPEIGATGPYAAAGGPPLPPMSDSTNGLPGGAGAEAIPGHEILGELGRGGMGVVYKARHLRLKRLVAVKMILAGEHAGSEHLARFRTESEAIARLQHPNIVQVFEVGEHREMPFFSLEFCGGGPLAAKLREKPMLPHEGAALVQILAGAMQAAHDKGVIHRDLKPANVLLADDGTPKISDFGLAKKLDEVGQTMPGVLMGTPSYMAPEQADSWRPVGPPADVYSLGAILYECLTGRPPFKAATTFDTILQVVSADPVPPRQLNPAVPLDLETICLKCLQKEPEKRYTPAQALAEDLDRFLKKEPILARPASRRERFAKWCRRNPRVAVLSGVIALAIVAYAVTTSLLLWSLYYQMGLKEQARIDAERNEEIAKWNANLALVRQNKAVGNMLSLAQVFMLRCLRQELVQGKPDARRAIVEDMLGELRKHLSRQSEDMELTPFDRVALHQHTGDGAREICLLGVAQQEYREGYQHVQKIVENEPNSDKARANMAVMDLRLGNITWELNGDVEAARKHFEKAQQLRQEIAAHPRSREYSAQQNDVALAYSALDLGRLEFAQGNLAAARKHLARALETRRAWANAPLREDQDMAPSYLSEACMWMGVVLAHQGDQEGADKHLQEALDLSDQLAKKDPTELSYKVDLAEIYVARGEVQALRSDWVGAFASYQKALDQAKLTHLPTAPDRRGQMLLARIIEYLAAVADKKGDAIDAKGRRAMSLTVRKNLTQIEPACVTWKAARLLALAHMDQQADDEAVKLAKRAAGNSELLLQLARYHAVRSGKAAAPAQRRKAVEQALVLLGDAVKAGYADRFTLAGDPDLAPLRQEASFQALLKKLAP